jgi:hypothetical protein
MRLNGFNAIEFAEKQNLKLNKLSDDVDGPAEGLTIAEAEAIATDDESLIYLEVPEELYKNSASSFQPDQ